MINESVYSLIATIYQLLKQESCLIHKITKTQLSQPTFRDAQLFFIHVLILYIWYFLTLERPIGFFDEIEFLIFLK